MKKNNLYHQLKQWLDHHYVAQQPTEIRSETVEQLINLEPIFNTQSNVFYAVLQKDLIQTGINDYLHRLKLGLENISYWHFHGRAITSLFPIPANFLLNESFCEALIILLKESNLPVGLIKMPLMYYKNYSIHQLAEPLEKLQRLGIILELKQFSGSSEDLNWMKSGFFKGVHCSTSLIRAASMTSYSKEIFDDLMRTCKAQNLHTYGEGISLVHDFIFTKKNRIDACYGTLLMPEVSKHQLLKIKTSQCNETFELTPVKKSDDGD
jgi:EAL domain-containing protein (putative c-di-GMP-specific phosphodiesterase class I)